MKLIHGGDHTTWHKAHPRKPLLDFSANINPLGLPDGVRRVLESCGDACTHYPDPLNRGLKAAIAQLEGVDEEWLLCGNGAADLIYRMAWGLAPKTALLLSPTFAEYQLALEAAGCAVHHHPLTEENGFAVDESILPRLAGMDLVFLCNPNNPTGRLIQLDLLVEIARHCQQSGGVLAVDECFLTFAEESQRHTMKKHLARFPNLVILKAFTKIYAIPGLRLGYAITADPVLRQKIEGAGPPWNVSVPAQLCGVAAAKDTAYLEKTQQCLGGWRTGLEQDLTEVGCTIFPSAVNYILFKGPADLAVRLAEQGVLIRDCSNFPGLSPGFFRTAVRTPEENTALIRAIKEIGSWQA